MSIPIKIGEFSQRIIDLLGLNISAGKPIYVGATNIRHMKSKHRNDYDKYYSRIPKILSMPDFVGIHPSDGSIQFVKTFGKHVKVAVRIADDGEYYVRSLYSITSTALSSFVSGKTLLPVDYTDCTD